MDALDLVFFSEVDFPPGVLVILLGVGLAVLGPAGVLVSIDGPFRFAAGCDAGLGGLASFGDVLSAGDDLDFSEGEGARF